ncbi:unnamed protein product [Thelazia callipaeda]|uniref:AN1-type domain-containing protein n=1 Tax=Thelazia callipaeda TaxID=103827 RepID=A0A0N5D0K6_THECL|nr:unnamed protein product [Thelazia callipaeda]
MRNDEGKGQSKEEEARSKDSRVIISSKQLQTNQSSTRPSNAPSSDEQSSDTQSSIVSVDNDVSSEKKNKNVQEKVKNDNSNKVLRALTSPGGRSPELSNVRKSSNCFSFQSTRGLFKSSSEKSAVENTYLFNMVTIKATISSFKPLRLVMKKSTSIRVLKNYLQSRLGGVHQIILVHGNKELKNEYGSLASAGVVSDSILWLLVKPVAGNNDREEIASLIRMSQSLANLRNLIRALPPMDSAESNLSESVEYVETSSQGQKEEEHEQIRRKMKLIRQRRRKIRNEIDNRTSNKCTKNSLENSERNTLEETNEKEELSELLSPSDSPCTSPVATPTDPADVVEQKELATYFDPPETIKEKNFQEELFDVPSNQSELLQIKDEVKNKRCGMCRIKLRIADREMQCLCGHVFCSKHRNPQSHRCSIDLKTVGREHIKMSLPKMVRDYPRSKT